MSRSIITAWTSLFIAIMLLLVRHPTCASCVAWMCCRLSDSIKHVWAWPDQSSRRGHRFSLTIMLFLVLRHPTCASCVPWMCCKMSDSIKHVWTCPDLSFDRLWLYTFLHSLRSNFAPSRPLQLWFEAACEASLFVCPVRNSEYRGSGRQNSLACLPGVTCLRNGRGCAAWELISYCNFHVVVSDTSSNLCIMCCMNVL